MLTMLQWLATALSFIGAAINIKRSRWGFMVWNVAAIIWIWWALLSSPIPAGLIVTQALFMCLNVYGFIEWSRPKTPSSDPKA